MAKDCHANDLACFELVNDLSENLKDDAAQSRAVWSGAVRHIAAIDAPGAESIRYSTGALGTLYEELSLARDGVYRLRAAIRSPLRSAVRTWEATSASAARLALSRNFAARSSDASG